MSRCASRAPGASARRFGVWSFNDFLLPPPGSQSLPGGGEGTERSRPKARLRAVATTGTRREQACQPERSGGKPEGPGAPAERLGPQRSPEGDIGRGRSGRRRADARRSRRAAPAKPPHQPRGVAMANVWVVRVAVQDGLVDMAMGVRLVCGLLPVVGVLMVLVVDVAVGVVEGGVPVRVLVALRQVEHTPTAMSAHRRPARGGGRARSWRRRTARARSRHPFVQSPGDERPRRRARG